MSWKSGDLFVEQSSVKHGEAVEGGHASCGHTVGLIECNALRDVPNGASDGRNHNCTEYGNCLRASDHQIRSPTGRARCPKDVALTDCVDHSERHQGSAAIDASEAARTHAISDACGGWRVYSATMDSPMRRRRLRSIHSSSASTIAALRLSASPSAMAASSAARRSAGRRTANWVERVMQHVYH